MSKFRSTTATVVVSATLMVALIPGAAAMAKDISPEATSTPSATSSAVPSATPSPISTELPTAAPTATEAASPSAIPSPEETPTQVNTPSIDQPKLADGNDAPKVEQDMKQAPQKQAPQRQADKEDANKKTVQKKDVEKPGAASTAGSAAFSDISGSPFQSDINWMEESGITNGWVNADGTKSYKPYQSISRDQMAAFLYRMAGEPAYTAPEASKFDDVAPGQAFYKEIHWMADMGVTNGWANDAGKPSFKPESPVSRGQMAAFLYRFSNNGDTYTYAAPATSLFKDVKTGQAFYKEMSWMKERSISNGWSDGSYRPESSITREQMAAFLHRIDTKVGISSSTAADWDTDILDARAV